MEKETYAMTSLKYCEAALDYSLAMANDNNEHHTTKVCDHTFKLASSGWRHVETYQCTKCGEEKQHHWYE